MNQSLYYRARINQALAHIDAHLAEDIQVNDLATAANFSPYHFQRVYKALQGETPYQTILRRRLEKAVFLLRNPPRQKIADIAAACGFETIENFSRQFKTRFGFSPSTFQKDRELQKSRIYQVPQENDFYTRIEDSRQEVAPSFEVTLETLPAIPMAYIRGIFGTDGSVLVTCYLQLMRWAETHHLPVRGARTRFGMSIDNPDVTPAQHYRYDFAVAAPADTPTDRLVEHGEIPGGLYATLHVEGKLEAVAQAWDYLYRSWLPESEFVPRHYPALEEFLQGPEEIGWENFNLKCRIPITKISE